MIRNILLTIGIVLAAHMLVYSQASGSLKGKVIDKETKEPIPFANIVLELDGNMIGGATSDFDGNYMIKPITPGKYDLKATFVGYQPFMIKGIIIGADKIVFQDISLNSSATNLEAIEIVDYKVPLISKDETSSGATVTSEEVAKMPVRSANAVATTVGGVFSKDGERGNVRGSRSDATVMYIDGIKVTGSSSLPPSAIEQVSVILSGVPAQYGDATGGVINVTTKGPSRKFGAGIEAETSEFLDKYGYNRLGLNVNGPIWTKEDTVTNNKQSVVGFFIAGDATYRGVDYVTANGIYKVKDDVLADLISNPLRPSGQGVGTYTNASFLSKDTDMELVKDLPNNEDFSTNLSAKFDIKASKTINLTVGGSFNYNQGNPYSFTSGLMNWDNYSKNTNYTWRVFGRFTQRFPNNPESNSFIKNIYYSIQADYTKFYSETESEQHGDNLFKIGYLGSFDTYTERSYELGDVTVDGQSYQDVYVHNGYRDTLFTFNPSDLNEGMANYTSQYYDLYPDPDFYRNSDIVQLGGGKINGQRPDAIYSMWSAPGAPYNGYHVVDNEQLGINVMASADVGNHAIQLGFQYEQKKNAGYGYGDYNGPSGLWTLMRGETNFHIKELDVNNPIAVRENGVFMDTVYYHRKYDGLSQRTFDYNLRQKLGLNTQGTDFINIDSYDFNNNTINYYDQDGNKKTVSVDGDLFDVSMFSADELLNDGLAYVYYYGYDYTGQKLSSKPTFEDFFTKKDERGDFIREVGAFEPIYMAGYIQDKFAFNDLIFNVGVRFDRFDANQLVLKDPFLLYPAKTAGEVTTLGGQTVTHPGNIGDDYIVYVDKVSDPSVVTGYRNGSTWYDVDGIEIADPNLLDAGSGVSPYLQDPSDKSIQKEVFEDYEPQTTIMPRISFSFPISDEALFFAHYDILAQRPGSNLRMNPVNYLYFDNRTQTISNPNLKPSKTIDYELGFKQKLTNTSSLSISAYYREMRDMIQVFRFNGAYPRDYTSYNNIDFGTTKGMTITYDLRRTNNARIRASYTLQFADGTGSSTTQAAALIAAGLPNLRTLTPLAWDRRHQFNVVFDYRWGEGKNYDGPRINRKDPEKAPFELLKNTGASVTLTGGSGTPYTRSSNITSAITGGTQVLQGSYYGSRLPWQFRVDLKVDRDIYFNLSKDEEGKKGREAYLNVYLQVLNVLNTENIMDVWPATGNANDDGYLAAAEWQRQINEQLDPASYRDMYSIFVDRPWFYSSPRVMRLGVIFNF